MRILVLLLALATPVVAWLSQTGAFGPDQGTISDRYPTLLVAAGYAFSIWSLIFVLDIVHGVLQLTGRRRQDRVLGRIAPATAAGFFLTAIWMPLFSQELFWLCLLVIFGALGCLAWSALVLSRSRGNAWSWLALSLHAGWLSLAAFLNLAQTIVAYEWLPTDAMLGWSAVLFVLAGALLLGLNHAMRGNWAYAAAALWGLVAVYLRQSGSELPGSSTAAWIAAAIGVVLVVQTVWLRMRRS
ncbi:hypothetical protein ACOPJQ_02960 [Luteimonas dalianensis]|uniref:hypothetical protein n=1 Tax=Luteimonas dalianensis TaxID=1148196 RepID=UPI003BF00CC2